MKTYVMYHKACISGLFTKHPIMTDALWEVVIDRASTEDVIFGHVLSEMFVCKPTKRQLRRMKREFRKEWAEIKARQEFENSWEGIHCHIIGL